MNVRFEVFSEVDSSICKRIKRWMSDTMSLVKLKA